MSEVRSAVVAGHLCLDLIPDLSHVQGGAAPDLLHPGHLITVGRAALSTGGPVSNTGLILHKLGIPVRLIAKVGDDPLGAAVRAALKGYSPDLLAGIRTDPQAETSYSIIISLPGRDRTFWHFSGANDTFGADDIPFDLVAGADLFHFGYPPVMRRMYADDGRELAEMLRRAKATGATTSVDMALPDPASEAGRLDWRRILKAALPFVDIFTPSIDELLYTLYRPTYEKLVEAPGGLLENVSAGLLEQVGGELLEAGVSLVLIKLGARGAYLRSAPETVLTRIGRAAPKDPSAWAGRRLWAPCFRVRVVGTTGSGDATIAGFLSGLLRGLTSEDAMTAAVAVGACNVEAADALSGIRTWDATMQRIAAGWPRLELALPGPSWTWDERHQLMVGNPG